jgi:erythromycin esterase-like protein
MAILDKARGGNADTKAQDVLVGAAQPLTGGSHDYDALLERIGDARFVLIGEASHGTHEFYNERARITRRLIEEKGFMAVAAEADWPDAYRVNRYLRGHGDGDTPTDALEGFTRFPQWMWRNTVVLDFLTDLAVWNASAPEDRQCGFYGLDLYSLYGSIASVIEYLERVDPEAARRARERYGCLGEFDPEPQRYGLAAAYGGTEQCEDDAVAQLVEMMRRRGEYANTDGEQAADEYFFAEQNARLVVDAERYYRAMYRGGRDNTWNLRDTHMADTLDALDRHLTQRYKRPAKIVVWAHNSHLGDARATEMGEERDELNLGQLVRQRHARDCYLIGFTTYTGSVTAANNWDEPCRRKRVRPALQGSVEELFHDVGAARGTPDFLLDLHDHDVAHILRKPLLERAIGVIYRPETERWSHYFQSRVAEQFDAVLHLEVTRALEPMEITPGWRSPEPGETYPSGL